MCIKTWSEPPARWRSWIRHQETGGLNGTRCREKGVGGTGQDWSLALDKVSHGPSWLHWLDRAGNGAGEGGPQAAVRPRASVQEAPSKPSRGRAARGCRERLVSPRLGSTGPALQAHAL